MRHFIVLLLIALTLGSCSSLKVNSERDKSIDFNQYKTFSFIGWSPKSNPNVSEIAKRKLEQAFKQQFEERGLTYTEGKGDIAVSLFIFKSVEISRTAYPNYYNYGGFGYGYHPHAGWRGPVGYGYGYGYATIEERQHEVRVLVCDVFDENTKDQIWHGSGRESANDIPSNVEAEKRINYVVNAIMSKYPVRKQKK
ncbi:DUF4136 domain-containing protein [Labilibacter sediminis]|nr:DUF4136 domain-containing protein [Labilibacter sediminis]